MGRGGKVGPKIAPGSWNKDSCMPGGPENRPHVVCVTPAWLSAARAQAIWASTSSLQLSPLPPRNFVAFQVLREEEFSPLKNADSADRDSPSTSRRALLAQHCRWALQAGARFLDVHGAQLPEQPR